MKRKVGYTDEHVSATRAKLSHMEIDEGGADASRSANSTTRGETD